MMHTHPMSNGNVEFSPADDAGNLRTFPFFHRMLPKLLHSCLVWNKDLKRVSGRIYVTNNTWVHIHKTEIIGRPECIHTSNQTDTLRPYRKDATYLAQALLLDNCGQAKIRNIPIGIIGQGGIGSCVSMIAIHTGFKSITGVDYDFLEEDNRPRIPSTTSKDANDKILKVVLNQQYAQNYDSTIEFNMIPLPVEHPDVAFKLKDCDILVITTDNTKSRAFLNQFCQQHYIPLLDLGTEFVASKAGDIVNDIGKVNLILPGTACLQCTLTLKNYGLSHYLLNSCKRKLVKVIYEGLILNNQR